MLRVLIASPSKPLSQSFFAALRNLPATMVAGVTENATTTQVALQRMNLEVVLLDSDLPEAQQVWRLLRDRYPRLHVIVLVENAQQQTAWQVVGAETTLRKDASGVALREALFAVPV